MMSFQKLDFKCKYLKISIVKLFENWSVNKFDSNKQDLTTTFNNNLFLKYVYIYFKNNSLKVYMDLHYPCDFRD